MLRPRELLRSMRGDEEGGLALLFSGVGDFCSFELLKESSPKLLRASEDRAFLDAEPPAAAAAGTSSGPRLRLGKGATRGGKGAPLRAERVLLLLRIPQQAPADGR